MNQIHFMACENNSLQIELKSKRKEIGSKKLN